MPFSSISLSQQSQYQQTFNQGRSISLLAKQKPEPQENGVQAHKDAILAQLAQFKESFPHAKNDTPEQVEQQSDDVYQRPIPPNVEIIRLILTSIFGENIDEDFADLDFEGVDQSSQTAISGPTSEAHPEFDDDDIVELDGEKFNAGDILMVEQWQSHQQSLSYQMQGEFSIDGRQIKLDYSFSLTSEYTSYSSVEITAGALKDPLIVQFGDRSLGLVEGSIAFDINRDDQADKLPIFAGDVGYLVYDKNNNKKADDGTELFGPTTGNGFAELSQLDSNQNGFIDHEDELYEQLYVWQPQRDGVISLTEANIKAISLNAIETPFSFYDNKGEIVAQMRQSSFALSDTGHGRGVHQVDVRI